MNPDRLGEVVRQAQGGDAAAWAMLVERYQDAAVGMAVGLSGTWSVGEDLAQEAFALAYRHLGDLRHPEAFSGWFFTLVRTACSRRARSRRLFVVSVEDLEFADVSVPDPAMTVERAEEQRQVRWVIEGLPEHERTVIALHYIGDLSYPEIAAFLGISPGAAKKRAFDARQRLKAVLPMVTAALVAARPSRSGRFRDTIRVFLAIRDRDHATVELLLRRDPTLASATEDWTPGEAITTGVGYAGKATALIRAAQTGDLGLVRLLVEAGALADGACACEGAETPLWSAVVQGNRDVVAYLLARVVDPNAPAFRGATPLHAAVQRGHDDLVPVLLAAGADPARTDDGGRAPSDWISARAARAGPRADAGDHVPTGIRAIDLFAPLFRGALQHWPPAYGLGQFVLLSALADHLRPAEFVHIGFSYGPYDPGGAAQEVNETGVPCVARLTPRDADPAEQRSYFAHALDEVTTHHGDQLVICLEAPGYLHDVAVALPALANSPSVVATIVVQPFTGSYPTPTADTPEGYHAQVVFDPRRARRALWPAVDPVHTTSRWWPSHRHAQLAEHVQQTFASYEAIDPELQLPDPHTTPDPALAATAQQLIRYLTQPFAITEPFTSEPGQRTPYDELLDTLEEALR